MTEWYKMIRMALDIYTNRDKYTYCLGACGEPIESERIKNLFEYYYNHGYKDKIGMTYEEWLNANRGKKCFDCSGFINYCSTEGETEHVYSSWNYGEMPKNISIAHGVEGSALWKRGHVGLDYGHGHFLHFPDWNRTCEEGIIKEYDWVSSHLILDVDYEGADNR